MPPVPGTAPHHTVSPTAGPSVVTFTSGWVVQKPAFSSRWLLLAAVFAVPKVISSAQPSACLPFVKCPKQVSVIAGPLSSLTSCLWPDWQSLNALTILAISVNSLLLGQNTENLQFRGGEVYFSSWLWPIVRWLQDGNRMVERSG